MSEQTRPAGVIRAVSAASADLPDFATRGFTRAVLCSDAMTVSVMDGTGEIISSLALPAGYNPLQLRQVRSISAGSMWALY